MASAYPLVYGLHDMEDYRDRTVQTVGIQVMNEALGEWQRAYTESTNAFLNAVVQRNPAWNTSPITRTRLPYMVDMQVVDEDGKADPVRNYLTYDIGLPLQRREIASGWSMERRKVLTVNDVNEWLYQVMMADMLSFRNAAKKALFYNSGWNFYSQEEDQNMPATIPIVPLANGDSQQYPMKVGSLATATHYTAQAAQVSNSADPFPALATKLTGYGTSVVIRPRLVAFIGGSALKAGVLGLDDFYEYEPLRYVRPGTGVTTVDDAINQELYFGDRVLGQHASGFVVVEWSDLPDNYIVAMDMDQQPLGMREKAEPELQGLFGVQDVLSHYGNEVLDRVRRIMGMAVVDRTAAAVHFVAAGDTTYDVPTGYTPQV